MISLLRSALLQCKMQNANASWLGLNILTSQTTFAFFHTTITYCYITIITTPIISIQCKETTMHFRVVSVVCSCSCFWFWCASSAVVFSFKAIIAIMRSLVSKRHLNLNPVIVADVISQELSLVKSHKVESHEKIKQS